MRSRVLLTVLAVLSLASSFAVAAPKDKTPKTIKCAVTGDALNVADATKHHMYADYKGRRYFFCCKGCPEQFHNNPAKYAKGPSIPTPKAPSNKK